MKKNTWLNIGIISIVIIGGVAGLAIFADIGSKNQAERDNNQTNQSTESPAPDSRIASTGYQLSNGRCEGDGLAKLTHLPMDPQDFSMIQPYGLVVGGHVTPIDHQYFAPADQNSRPDAYPVYAMADSRIVDITTRQHPGFGANAGQTITDYRLVFTISCRLLYYYDLVTELEPALLQAWETQGRNLDYRVTAGDRIGSIGGQTLDFAVWDTSVKLSGFIRPESYIGESWKIHTVDPLEYYTDELRAQALSKYIRTAEPRSGKIDYDRDGTIVGNWFAEGTNGYAGPDGNLGQNYWTGHLAIAPNFIDPSAWMISIGNWPTEASQFTVPIAATDPNSVTPETGLVKYELHKLQYTHNGRNWNFESFASPIRAEPSPEVAGCFLVQMLENQRLKAQAFSRQSCSAVSGFTSAATEYTR